MAVVPGPPFPGMYQHFRGDVVQVHRIVADQSNIDVGRLKVLYERIFDGRMLVRDVREFNEVVHVEDGTPSVIAHLGSLTKTCGMCVPRFHQMTPDEIVTHNGWRKPKES